MITPSPTQPLPDQLSDLDRELRQHGITRVRVDKYEVNGFRYSHAKDAIAEAKRRPQHTSSDTDVFNPNDPKSR